MATLLSSICDCINSEPGSKLSFESFVENGGEEGVEFGCGLGFQAFQPVHFRLQRIQFGHDPALLGERRKRLLRQLSGFGYGFY